jgi:hypothetical protein
LKKIARSFFSRYRCEPSSVIWVEARVRLIVVPLAAPGLVVAALFTLFFAWNDFAYVAIFL